MKKILASLLLSLLLAGAATAGSTIDPSSPSDKSKLMSLPIRNNFAAAYQDINNILGVFAGTTAPATPTNLQSWADYSTSPVVTFRYWNATTGTWVPYSLLNINTGVVTPYMASGGFVANAPVTVSVTGGVATFGMALDSNFAVRSGQLGLANQFYGHMMANCTGNPTGEPGDCSWSQFADLAIAGGLNSIPIRGVSTWGAVTAGTSGHSIPFLDGVNTWSGAQTVYGGGGVPAAAQAGTLFRAVALDGVLARYEADSFGSNGAFTCVRAENTLAAPQALANNSVICQVGSTGHDGSTYQSAIRAGIRTYAAQTWSVGANGTRAGIFTTPNGGTATADVIGFENDGGVTIPPTVTGGSKGAGTVNVGGALYNNGVLISGTGTVTNATIVAGTGVALSGTCVITSSGSCTINNAGVVTLDGASGVLTVSPPLSVVGGDLRATTLAAAPAAHSIPINQGASAQTNTGTGTTGQCAVSGGASADPSFIAGCRVLLNTLTASGSATLSDTTSLTATYSQYEIVFSQIIPATNGAAPQFQVHSGGTFKSTGYLNGCFQIIGGTNGGCTAASSVNIALAPNSTATDAVNNPKNTTPGMSGVLRLSNPSASQITNISVNMGFLNAANAAGVLVMANGFWNTAGAIDGFQFAFNTGNITSGTIKVYGIQQ